MKKTVEHEIRRIHTGGRLGLGWDVGDLTGAVGVGDRVDGPERDLDDIPAEAWPEHRRILAARFLEAGWGDRAFYESPEAGVRLALKAAFSSEGSVLHVAGFDPPPATYFSRAEIIAIELSGRGVPSRRQRSNSANIAWSFTVAGST